MATSYKLQRSSRDLVEIPGGNLASENSNTTYSVTLSSKHHSFVGARSGTVSSSPHMNEKSSPAPYKQGKNTSTPIDDEQTLIKDIVAMSLTTIRALLKKYESALRSAQDGEPSYPLYFLVYCVIKMERKGAEIRGNTLLQECYGLEDVHSDDFIDRLKVNLKGSRLFDFSSFTASETVGRGESGVISSTENDSNEESEPELSEEDIVDGLSHTSIGASGSFESSVDSGFMSASLEYPIAISTKHSNNPSLRGNSSRGADSQTKTSQTNTQLNGGVVSQTKVGETNTRIQEKLFALNNENILLESCRLCVKCRERPRGITFLPCGHFTMCRECAGPTYVCSLCHKNVLATVDTFLS